jgi:nucleotidyltransferase/DNA polymerase involved in DNA repair
MAEGARALTQRFVHLEAYAFFAAVEVARDPALAGRPVVVGGRPDGPGLVIDASPEARARGVLPGLPLRRAARLCPEAIFVEGRIGPYLDAARRLRAIVARFAAGAEWLAIDEVCLEVDGAGAPASAVRLAEALHRQIEKGLGIGVACGIATTRVVARVAARLMRPRGLLAVLPGYERRVLAPLALERLPGLDAATAARLRAAGIRTLGELAALDPLAAIRLAGRAGAVFARLAAGRDPAGAPPTDRSMPCEAPAADRLAARARRA